VRVARRIFPPLNAPAGLSAQLGVIIRGRSGYIFSPRDLGDLGLGRDLWRSKTSKRCLGAKITSTTPPGDSVEVQQSDSNLKQSADLFTRRKV
jgi:hypothetical protein